MDSSAFLLPLPLIAWAFTIAGLGALFMGAALLTLLYKAGRLPGAQVDYTAWNDVFLLSVWAVSFIGGMGLLSYKSWAPLMLEYFCWVLIALTALNAATRAKIMKDKFAADPSAGPFRWGPVVAGSLVVLIPITAFCGATIYTLHDPATQQQLRAGAAVRQP